MLPRCDQRDKAARWLLIVFRSPGFMNKEEEMNKENENA